MQVFSGAFSNQGVMAAEGTALAFFGNTLFNGGAFSTGFGIGNATLQGTFTQQSGGRFETDISNLGNDLFTVTGTANLQSVLDIIVLGSFTPLPGASFTILAAGSVNGVFSTVTGSILPGNMELLVSYLPSSVSLIATDKPSAGNDDIFGTAQNDSVAALAGDDILTLGLGTMHLTAWVVIRVASCFKWTRSV